MYMQNFFCFDKQCNTNNFLHMVIFMTWYCSVRKAWIEVLMHPDLPKNVEDRVRERLKTAIDGALICSPESTGLKV